MPRFSVDVRGEVDDETFLAGYQRYMAGECPATVSASLGWTPERFAARRRTLRLPSAPPAPRWRNPLTCEATYAAHARYMDGVALRQVARDARISESSLRGRFIRLGLPFQPAVRRSPAQPRPARGSLTGPWPPTPDRLATLLSLRAQGAGLVRLADACAVPYERLRDALVAAGADVEPAFRPPVTTLPATATLAQLVVAGASFPKIAADFGVSPDLIRKRLRLAGAHPKRGTPPERSERIERMARLYRSGLSCLEIAQELDMTPAAVGKALRRAGLPLTALRRDRP